MAFTLSLGLGACAGDERAPDAGAWAGAGRGSQAPASTVVVLPDTQFYTCAYPQIFQEQAEWVVAEHERAGIALVLHTGDIVDSDVRDQWQVAADSLHRLDGVVPYMITAGNHDLSAGRASLIGEYFGPTTLAAQEGRVEVREPGRLDNSFSIIELAGRPWLVLGLEFGPRDAVLQWASEVLSAHADKPVLLFTHAYLYSDGRRYDRSVAPAQPYHPDAYGLTPEQGIADGEDIWTTLVEPHENIKLVVCGHVIPDGTERATAVRRSGTRVHQLLANYQMCDRCPCAEVEGGGGYLRLLEFEAAGRSVRVSTYSPHLHRSLDDDDNAFVLELDLP